MFRVFFCSRCFRKRKWAELKSAPLTSRLMKKISFFLNRVLGLRPNSAHDNPIQDALLRTWFFLMLFSASGKRLR